MNRTIVIVALAAALLVLPLFTNPYWTDVCVSIGLYALLALSLRMPVGRMIRMRISTVKAMASFQAMAM